MRHFLKILTIFLISLTLISCSEDSEESSETSSTTSDDTTAPSVSSISPTDDQSSVSISDNISVTFSEAIDNSSVITNTDNTSCLGSILLSSDNFSNCIQMESSPSSSNSEKTFTVTPSSKMFYSTTYLIRVTTSAKDSAGNNIATQYTCLLYTSDAADE